MSHSTHASGATLRGSDFVVRCAEAEFGFEMAADVPAGKTYTAESIKDFVVFWQKRIGRGGRNFLLYKFRTLQARFDRNGEPNGNGDYDS